MNQLDILKKFNKSQLRHLSSTIGKYFVLVKPKRIYELIMQVDSVDIALDLLLYHQNSGMTIDEIVYYFLLNKDNTKE